MQTIIYRLEKYTFFAVSLTINDNILAIAFGRLVPYPLEGSSLILRRKCFPYEYHFKPYTHRESAEIMGTFLEKMCYKTFLVKLENSHHHIIDLL